MDSTVDTPDIAFYEHSVRQRFLGGPHGLTFLPLEINVVPGKGWSVTMFETHLSRAGFWDAEEFDNRGFWDAHTFSYEEALGHARQALGNDEAQPVDIMTQVSVTPAYTDLEVLCAYVHRVPDGHGSTPDANWYTATWMAELIGEDGTVVPVDTFSEMVDTIPKHLTSYTESVECAKRYLRQLEVQGHTIFSTGSIQIKLG